MITALCLNPCIDRTVEIAEFAYGGMNRILSSREDGSGKGVNVAIVTAKLGMRSQCVGFMYESNGHVITQRLEREGALGRFVHLPGAVRTNLKILDRSRGVITEVNESGAQVSVEQIEELTRLTLEYARASDYLVLTGSAPPGCPPGIYRDLIAALGGSGCRCVLDAEGEKLTLGITGAPYMVKPNQYELELAVGRKLNSVTEIRDAALRFIEKGVALVVVSMGGEGALITDGEQSLYAPGMKIPVRSTVGAGDSMVSGILHGLTEGCELAETFRRGVACASASVMTEGTQLVDAAQYRALLSGVEMRRV